MKMENNMTKKYNELKTKLLCFFIIFLFPSICFAAKYGRSSGGKSKGVVVFLVLFFFMAIVFFIVGILFIINLIRKKLSKETIEYCNKNGYKYVEKASKLPIGDDFALVNIGTRRGFRTLMVGEKNGVPFILGDYDYKIRQGSTIYFLTATICVMTDSDSSFSHFYLADNSYKNYYSGIRLLDLLGGKKTEIINNKTFSSKYLIKSDYPEEVNSFFDENKIEIFNTNFKENYLCEAKGKSLMLFENNIMRMEDKIQFLDDSTKMFSSIISNS